jgi:hypothetical protein
MAGIYEYRLCRDICISWLRLVYVGITGMLVMTCRHISGYAGLTYLISYAGEGMPGYLTYRVGGPAYRSGI